MNKEEFIKSKKNLKSYRYHCDDIFYEESSTNGYVDGRAKIFHKQDQYSEVRYSYPETDSEAKMHIHHVLQYIRTSG